MFSYNRTLDLDGVGLGMFLTPYQQDALEYLYAAGQGGSREVWSHVNRPGAPDPKSRASIINYLNALAEEGLVAYREKSGKGGYHRVYTVDPAYPTLEELTHELVLRLLTKVAAEFKMAIGYRWQKEGHIAFVREEES